MSGTHPIIQGVLEAHGAPKPRVTHPDIADGVRYIAAHEPDPRKEELLYEAAELLEWYETSGKTDEHPRFSMTKTNPPITPGKAGDALDLARRLYEAHAKFHGFSGERWNDEPWQSRHSWLNIAKTAIEAIQPLPSSDKERE